MKEKNERVYGPTDRFSTYAIVTGLILLTSAYFIGKNAGNRLSDLHNNRPEYVRVQELKPRLETKLDPTYFSDDDLIAYAHETRRLKVERDSLMSSPNYLIGVKENSKINNLNGLFTGLGLLGLFSTAPFIGLKGFYYVVDYVKKRRKNKIKNSS